MNDPRPAAIPSRPIQPPIQRSVPAGPQPLRPVARVSPPVATTATPARPAVSLDEPLTLVDEMADPADTVAAPPASKIKFGPDTAHKQHTWKRTPISTGFGACRVKSFHAKYSDQGIEHIDDAINEWLDDHAEVEVKFVTTTVHVFEGKIREPAIVMNLWY